MDANVRVAIIILLQPDSLSYFNLSVSWLHLLSPTGYSCSDLSSVCKEAAMAPVRELLGSGGSGSRSSREDGQGRAAQLRVLMAAARSNGAARASGVQAPDTGMPAGAQGTGRNGKGGGSRGKAGKRQRSATTAEQPTPFAQNSANPASTGTEAPMPAAAAVAAGSQQKQAAKQCHLAGTAVLATVRKLTVGDFTAAITKIRPSSVDQGAMAL